MKDGAGHIGLLEDPAVGAIGLVHVLLHLEVGEQQLALFLNKPGFPAVEDVLDEAVVVANWPTAKSDCVPDRPPPPSVTGPVQGWP